MTTTQPLPPIPVGRLVGQVCDDGSDYDDGVLGYCRGTYDPRTRILTLSYERDDEAEADPDDPYTCCDSAEYRFQLLDPTPEETHR